MAGTLVPPWYMRDTPGQTEILFVTFLWGFTMALAIFICPNALRQTYRAWTRRRGWNAYIIMVWVCWACSVVIAVIYWFFIMGNIEPSFFFFIGILILWTIQMQCLTQIMANRISLVLYDPEKARRLRLAVAMAIGVINISVFVIWIPARLQISHEWVFVNSVWDRIEKVLFLLIDLFLNAYFMWLVKIKLVESGLTQYRVVYRFNLGIVCISISMDIAIICSMAAPVDTVYIEAHAVAYMVKLFIEMNLAELLGKVVKISNQQRIACTTPGGWQLDSLARFSNREHCSPDAKTFKATGYQRHSLNPATSKGKELENSELNDNRVDGVDSLAQEILVPSLPHYRRASIASTVTMDTTVQRLTCVCMNQNRAMKSL